jgi:predicted unusual protein kinase regulating ubiquinone biosynthesis (AarF/ABC1/UbiB family)
MTSSGRSSLPRRLGRALRLGTSSALAGAGWTAAGLLDRLGGDGAARALLRSSSARVASRLGRMKGLAMKVGQYLSFALPELPPEVREALAVLQTTSAPRPAEEIAAVIEAELGRPVGTLFPVFEPAPAAAASIGQVHRARLPDGTEVAVKVQYPGIADAVRADLANAGMLIRLVRTLVPGLDAEGIAAELRARLLEELDYRLEARRQLAFGERYAGHPFLAVPAVFPSHSAERVLTTAWAAGRDFRTILDDPAPVRARHGEILFRFLLGAILREGVIVADPHPGNYRFDAAGARTTLLDFGCVKELGAATGAALGALLRGALEADRDAVRDAVERLGLVAPGAVGEAVSAGAAHLYAPFAGHGVEPFPRVLDAAAIRAAAGGDLGDLRRALRIPGELPFVQRTVVGLYSVLHRLDARANWHGIAREYACGDPPATELGAAEREWRTARGAARAR